MSVLVLFQRARPIMFLHVGLTITILTLDVVHTHLETNQIVAGSLLGQTLYVGISLTFGTKAATSNDMYECTFISAIRYTPYFNEIGDKTILTMRPIINRIYPS